MFCDYHPELLVDIPLGMHHCPSCGVMVVSGFRHPPIVYFRDGDDVTGKDIEFLGCSTESGWFFMNFMFDEGGPFPTYEEACEAYKQDKAELEFK